MAKILVVEDDNPIRNLIVRNLELVGHICDYAEDGISATDLLENNNYDLIILDVMLPYVSGFDLICSIKNTPVIIVTAKNS